MSSKPAGGKVHFLDAQRPQFAQAQPAEHGHRPDRTITLRDGGDQGLSFAGDA